MVKKKVINKVPVNISSVHAFEVILATKTESSQTSRKFVSNKKEYFQQALLFVHSG